MLCNWADTFIALQKSVAKEMPVTGNDHAPAFVIARSFDAFDMTRLQHFANVDLLLEQDFYVLNHEEFRPVFARMVGSAPENAKFVVIDRREKQVEAAAFGLLQNSGLDVDEPVRTSSGGF